MLEKVAALSNPEYKKHYSSLPDEEVLQLWNTTPPNDTERYFIYREILGSRPGLESGLASNQNNRPKFLHNDEYLIAKYREGGWPDGGFATFKAMSWYFYFVFVPITAMALLLRAGVSYPGMSWLIPIWSLLLILFLSNTLINSHLVLTNQRIGYQISILRVFRFSPKFMSLKDGYFISDLHRIYLGFLTYFMQDKDTILKNTWCWFRLDKHAPVPDGLNLSLKPELAIYFFELLQLVVRKTDAMAYTPALPIVDPINGKKFIINYHFKECTIHDLQEMLRAINLLSTAGCKKTKYIGKANIEYLASFFASTPAVQPEEHLLKIGADDSESILAYFYDFKGSKRKRPLLCFTTYGVKCYKKSHNKLKFEYNWADPHLTLEVSLLSVDIMYKKKRVGYVIWSAIDVPLLETLASLGMDKIYPSNDISM